MIDLEVSFEERPWERYLNQAPPWEPVSAARLLTLLEGEDEAEVEEAMDTLERRGLTLSLEDLPRTAGAGQAAVRLRQETALVRGGLNIRDLEENDPLRLYLEELAQTPAEGDEERLAQAGARGEADAMAALTNLGLKRVVELAKDYAGFGVLLLDLIQEGSLGLWQAIQGYREGAYGPWRDQAIRLYMARAVLLQARANGVGQRLRQAMEDYRQVDERLLGELGRNPTLEEIASQLHMSAEQARAVQKVLEDARILAKVRPAPEEDRSEERQAVEDTALFQSRARVLDLLSGLEERDAALLSLRFGLEGGRPLTPEQTAARLGLTPSEVTRREQAALSRLRREPT